jgi:hypothetical protein
MRILSTKANKIFANNILRKAKRQFSIALAMLFDSFLDALVPIKRDLARSAQVERQ